ncbi:hypothetical protein [Streptomyces sp. NPDC017529]|uniref:hypothetical protein n=1 Tax=Streptomyces sp. NPDC017529 TaxID=3365000 RepID=UPI00378DDC6B
MTWMRGVGCAAAVVAAGVLVAGCSGGGGGEKPGSAETTAGAASSAAPSTPETSWEATLEQFPDTPTGRLDRTAQKKGWVVDGLYASASAYVADICESMTAQKGFGTDPGEWLATTQKPEGDEEAVLRAGMPSLCPKWWPVAKKALAGGFVRSYGDGTYTVKAKPQGDEEIAPGTYRVKDVKDCYWERTSKGGEILDNQFATAAQQITVTVRSTDGSFTARGCGQWRAVQ